MRSIIIFVKAYPPYPASPSTSKLTNVEKLDKVALSFDVNQKVLSASGYQGKNVGITFR